MQKQTIETVKKGEFVRLNETSKKTYLSKGYCRFNKGYEIGNWDDFNDTRYLKKGRLVVIVLDF